MMQGVGGGGGASSGGSGCVGYAPDKLILVFPMCQFGFGQSDYIRTVLYYRLQGVNIGGGVWYARRKKNSDAFFNFVIVKEFVSKNLMNGCDCCGPDGRLDTKISQID